MHAGVRVSVAPVVSVLDCFGNPLAATANQINVTLSVRAVWATPEQQVNAALSAADAGPDAESFAGILRARNASCPVAAVNASALTAGRGEATFPELNFVPSSPSSWSHTDNDNSPLLFTLEATAPDLAAAVAGKHLLPSP